MISDDIVGSYRRKALVAALNIAGAHLTRDQRLLLAGCLAGKSESTIMAMWDAVLPPEDQCTGIILPYLTMGRLSEYASRVHDLVVVLLGLQYRDSREAAPAAKIVKSSDWFVRRGPANGRAVGSAQSYDPTTAGVGPPMWSAVGSEVAPATLWASTGLSPGSLSLGWSGTEEIKGHLPDVGYAGYKQTRRSPTPDRSLLEAQHFVEQWEEGMLPGK